MVGQVSGLLKTVLQYTSLTLTEMFDLEVVAAAGATVWVTLCLVAMAVAVAVAVVVGVAGPVHGGLNLHLTEWNASWDLQSPVPTAKDSYLEGVILSDIKVGCVYMNKSIKSIVFL